MARPARLAVLLPGPSERSGYDRVAGPGWLASLRSEVKDTSQPKTERGSTKAAPRCRCVAT